METMVKIETSYSTSQGASSIWPRGSQSSLKGELCALRGGIGGIISTKPVAKFMLC